MNAAPRDVVVVGAGNAALCAAVAARLGGADVAVLEAAPREKRGGNSWFTDGAIRFAHGGLSDLRAVIPEMDDAEAARIRIDPYPPPAFAADLTRMSEGQADPVLVEALARESLATMGWLHAQGVRFGMIYDNQAFLKDGVHHFWGGLSVKSLGRGIGLMDALFRRAEELGIEVLYGSRVTALHRDGSGFRLEVGDGDAQVRCRRVVLANGGFEASARMRVEHLGEPWEGALVRGTEFNVGDGLQMALSLGAARAGGWSGCHAIATDAGAPAYGDRSVPGDVYKKHSYPLGILVNRRGERFLDEGLDFRNYTYARYGKAVLNQPGGIAYQIFDDQVAHLLRDEYNRPEATRVEASTVAELADLLAIDPDALVETVTRYNEAVGEGAFRPEEKDGKRTHGLEPPKSNWALRLEAPPFLAFPVRCAITFTFGGVRIDGAGRVLSATGVVIPGMYAAGEMAGGLFFGNYPGGAGLIAGATFGRLAGTDAATALLP